MEQDLHNQKKLIPEKVCAFLIIYSQSVEGFTLVLMKLNESDNGFQSVLKLSSFVFYHFLPIKAFLWRLVGP